MRVPQIIAVSVLLMGCEAITGPGERLVPGTISFGSDPVVIEVPDTVALSVPFLVRVRTYGGGCERIGPTEVTLDARSALVEPFDYTVSGRDVSCTLQLKAFSHEASLTFDFLGSATVVVKGVETPGRLPFERIHEVWVR